MALSGAPLQLAADSAAAAPSTRTTQTPVTANPLATPTHLIRHPMLALKKRFVALVTIYLPAMRYANSTNAVSNALALIERVSPRE